MNRIRIGNQTSVWCPEPFGPFAFAVEQGFGAFEWFADKKVNPDGTARGWDESDMGPDLRAWIRDAGRKHDVLFTVHAPWQANPLHAEGIEHLLRSIEFARDIGAGLVNLHLYMDEGADAYVAAMLPVIRAAAAAKVRLSVENTPHTTPDDFNQTFVSLATRDAAPPGAVGMCLDLGHANLCRATHNDYIAYLHALAPAVPVVHLHVHENHGDADSHLPLFTGPAGADDSGVRAFVKWLERRHYAGALILEQWPDPPELLTAAARRLSELLGQEPPVAGSARAESLSTPPINAPLSPEGRGDGGEGFTTLQGQNPSPPSPLPSGERGE